MEKNKDPSNRPSTREEFLPEKESQNPEEYDVSGNGSLPSQESFTSGTPPGPPKKYASKAPPDPPKKLTKTYLKELERHLTIRDYQVLESLKKYRFMNSRQVGRLFITDCSTKTSQTRQQNLLLQRLSRLGLIRSLVQSIGGYGGGSKSKVWHLTEPGFRLINLDQAVSSRKRFLEPSTLHLEHTLAITECAVNLTCLCRDSEDLSLDLLQTEPPCWRRFNAQGKPYYLKPDLFLITSYDNYEDRWFIEMDLGTEAGSQIISKCNSYLMYYYTGIEQAESEMFPLVVWLARDEARKEYLKNLILDHMKASPKMFLVITMDELEKMLRQFIDTKELC